MFALVNDAIFSSNLGHKSSVSGGILGRLVDDRHIRKAYVQVILEVTGKDVSAYAGRSNIQHSYLLVTACFDVVSKASFRKSGCK